MNVSLIAMSEPRIAGVNSADELIAYCARVSNPTNQLNNESAGKLLRYLVRNQHWSPFEMVSATFEIQTTRDIARQILRHRSFSFQEFSQRYAAVAELSDNRPARMQDAKNRQNSTPSEDAELATWWDKQQAFIKDAVKTVYESALAKGIAKEVARVVLPEGLTPSRLYMAGSLRSWLHYVMLRQANGTQLEHRLVAEQVREILCLQFPSIQEFFELEGV